MQKRKPATPRPRGRKSGIRAVINGARVREVREKRGWTQMDLAYRAGMFTGDLSAVENGYRDLRTPTFLKLVVALEVSSDYLLNLTDDPRVRK